MVAAKKIYYFTQRVKEARKRMEKTISTKYPEIKTDYGSLIAEGKGKLRSEQEKRHLVAQFSMYESCEPRIPLTQLFTFEDEQARARIAEEKRIQIVHEELMALERVIKTTMDLIHFGTDDQLKAALDSLDVQ